MATRRLPRIITTALAAELIGGDEYDARDMLRMFRKLGIGQMVGRRYIVTRTEIKAVMPALALELEMAAAEGLSE